MASPAPVKKRRQYSPRKRLRIFEAIQAGRPILEVAQEESVPSRSIHGITRRCLQQIDGNDRQRPGRPAKLTERDKRLILRVVKKDPSVSYEEVVKRLDLGCSVKTVRRYLKTQGFQSLGSVVMCKAMAAQKAGDDTGDSESSMVDTSS